MTKTPIFSRIAALAGRKSKRGLREPFLSPESGRLHTTRTFERSRLKRRWLVLFLTSFLMTGNYYCYDNPAALNKQLAAEFADLPAFDYYFDMMYSVYSIPNMFLPMFGGMLVDRVGIRFSLNLFAVFILAGQVAFAAGCSAHSMSAMLLGRLVFGLGGESISVAQSAMIERWFKDGELALALGASLSIARLGSVRGASPYPPTRPPALPPPAAGAAEPPKVALPCPGSGAVQCQPSRAAAQVINNALSPLIAESFLSVAAALWVGAAFCLVSLFCCLLLAWIDDVATKAIAANAALVLVASPPPPTFARLPLGQASPSTASKPPAKKAAVMLDQMGKFSRPFWLLALCCVVVYGTVLPFNNVASALLQDRDYFPHGTVWPYGPRNASYTFTEDAPTPPGVRCTSEEGANTAFCLAQAAASRRAGLVMSEPYMISAVLTPLLGLLVDRYGHRATMVVVSAGVLTLSHLLMALTALPAELLLLGIGLGYSIFACVIWPSIPSVVERSTIGTAYGLVTTLQNFGLFVLPLTVGLVLDLSRAGGSPVDNPYRNVELFFATLGLAGLLAGVALNADEDTRRALNTPGGRLDVLEWDDSRSASPLPSPKAERFASPVKLTVLREGQPSAFSNM